MNKIEVAILNQNSETPGGIMTFLARLTQHGHNIKSMNNLLELYNDSIANTKTSTISRIAQLPHGTIKRFSPITIAIVGASRRFLLQARTHQVGMDYVSASLQYSTWKSSEQYDPSEDFMVPYEILASHGLKEIYLESCCNDMRLYSRFINEFDCSNDTAGYLMPHALRNVLIIQGNHQSWDYFIRLRSCKRNTDETRYIATLIWEILYNDSMDGHELFGLSGPDCMNGKCREGKMSCGLPFYSNVDVSPSYIISKNWPMLRKENI